MNTANIRQSLYQCLENSFDIPKQSQKDYIFLCESNEDKHCATIYITLDNDANGGKDFISFTIANGTFAQAEYANITSLTDDRQKWFKIFCQIDGSSAKTYKYYLERNISFNTSVNVRKELKYGNFSNLVSSYIEKPTIPSASLIEISSEYNNISNGRYVIADNKIYFNQLVGKDVNADNNDQTLSKKSEISNVNKITTNYITVNKDSTLTGKVTTGEGIANTGTITSTDSISTSTSLSVGTTSSFGGKITSNDGINNTGGITSTGGTALTGEFINKGNFQVNDSSDNPKLKISVTPNSLEVLKVDGTSTFTDKITSNNGIENTGDFIIKSKQPNNITKISVLPDYNPEKEYLLKVDGTSTFTDKITSNGDILIAHTTTNDMSPTTANPKISFAEIGENGQPEQHVHLVYTDYNDYRSPAGLKVMGNGKEGDSSKAWFEVEGETITNTLSVTNTSTFTDKITSNNGIENTGKFINKGNFQVNDSSDNLKFKVFVTPDASEVLKVYGTSTFTDKITSNNGIKNTGTITSTDSISTSTSLSVGTTASFKDKITSNNGIENTGDFIIKSKQPNNITKISVLPDYNPEKEYLLKVDGTSTFTGLINANGNIKGDLNGNATTSTNFDSDRTLTLGDNLVKNSDIAQASVTSNSGDYTISSLIINDKAVTGAKIDDTTITNDKLVHSKITLGTTDISLGSSTDTLSGMIKITSALFEGNLNGNATTSTNFDSDRTLTLGDNLVKNSDIAQASVTSNSGNYTISKLTINNKAVTGSKIDNKTITPANLGNILSTTKSVLANGITVGLTQTSNGALEPTLSCSSVSNADQFSSKQSISLTGDVTGSFSSKAGWTIPTTVYSIVTSKSTDNKNLNIVLVDQSDDKKIKYASSITCNPSTNTLNIQNINLNSKGILNDIATAPQSSGNKTYNNVIASRGYVDDKIESAHLDAMKFKGTINGPAEWPKNEYSTKGDFYKIAKKDNYPINDSGEYGEHNSRTLNVGDTVIYYENKWSVIPSGDDIEDTWRPILINNKSFLNSELSSGNINICSDNTINLTPDPSDSHKITMSVDPSAHNHDSSYIKRTGDTISGDYTINGSYKVSTLSEIRNKPIIEFKSNPLVEASDGQIKVSHISDNAGKSLFLNPDSIKIEYVVSGSKKSDVEIFYTSSNRYNDYGSNLKYSSSHTSKPDYIALEGWVEKADYTFEKDNGIKIKKPDSQTTQYSTIWSQAVDASGNLVFTHN